MPEGSHILKCLVTEFAHLLIQRVRPWFVAASSGPKDVVLLIDTSGSMSLSTRESLSETRWSTTRDALLKMIGTFGPRDHINVVAFSNDATVLLDEKTKQGDNVLVKATDENIQRLRDAIKSFHPNGGTDFRSGFATAFDILIASTMEEKRQDIPPTSDCEKVGNTSIAWDNVSIRHRSCNFKLESDTNRHNYVQLNLSLDSAHGVLRKH